MNISNINISYINISNINISYINISNINISNINISNINISQIFIQSLKQNPLSTVFALINEILTCLKIIHIFRNS